MSKTFQIRNEKVKLTFYVDITCCLAVSRKDKIDKNEISEEKDKDKHRPIPRG